MRYVVCSLEYKQITDVLKIVDRLHRLIAHLLMQNTNEANLEALEDTGRPRTNSTPASRSHDQRATPHQVVTRLDPPPPLHASPAPEFPPPLYASPTPEFPPPPHTSPSLEILPRTAHAVSDLEILLPTAHASSHPAYLSVIH